VVAFLEANSVTGPARNLLEFCQLGPVIPDPWGPVEIVLATFQRPHQKQDPFLEAAAASQIKVEVIPEQSALDFGTLGRMRELLGRIQPDILQTHNVKSNFLVFLSGLAKQYPWIAWHHGYTRPTRKQELYNRFDRVSLRRARRVVTVTSAFVPELLAAGVPRDRIEIIKNAIQPDWIKQEDSPASPREPGTKTVLAIGRLSKEKAHADLIEAVALAPKGVQIILVGEGPERENLTQLAQRLQVKLTLTGQVQNVRPYFGQSDVFVLPSHSEGSPNVLIEAMAAGMPIVSTSVGGVADLLDHEKEALLVPPANPQALAAALKRMFEHRDLAASLAKAAQARASAELQPEPRALRIAQLYRNVLG
jgi:glycosyltransferase involved in cell wall biosynthesis